MATLRPSRKEWHDLCWRALWTFVQAFSGFGVAVVAMTAGGTVDAASLTNLSVVAGGAGVAAVLSLVKTFASNRLGTGTTTLNR